jgi:hypothetical protein
MFLKLALWCFSCCRLLLPPHVSPPCRYAGIGGLSEALGWTEVQQEEKSGFMGGVNGVLGLVALILAADLALFG